MASTGCTDLISRKALVKAILAERDKIPLEVVPRYGFGVPVPERHGQAMRGGIRKALHCVETATAVDAVEVVRCKDCENFWEYTEEHKATVENADGDCAIRKWRSDDEQFCAVTKDDYCSLARRKKDATD